MSAIGVECHWSIACFVTSERSETGGIRESRNSHQT